MLEVHSGPAYSGHLSFHQDHFHSSPGGKPLLAQQTTEYKGHDGTENAEPVKAWRPLMLRRWVLATFAVLFLLLIVSLEIILKVSKDRHGFGPIDRKLYYVWTYGPTAVFSIIAAFWTQVDYRARRMQPWEEMAKQSQSTPNSLLLDYISPNPVIVFFRSLRNRHWPVVAGLLGSVLLKVLIVVSPGLFILQLLLRPLPVTMTKTTEFDFSKLNMSIVDDRAGLIHTGIMSGEVNYPIGTNAQYATELFNTTVSVNGEFQVLLRGNHRFKYIGDEEKYKLKATSSVFTADLSCESATIDPNLKLKCPEGVYCIAGTALYTMTVFNEDCHMSNFSRNEKPLQLPNQLNGTRFWFGDVLFGKCDGDNRTAEKKRVVVYSIYQLPGSTKLNGTAILCKPSIQLQQSQVTIDNTGALLGVDEASPLPPPDNLDVDLISAATLSTVEQIYREKKDPAIIHQYPEAEARYGYGAFFSMILKRSGTGAFEDLWKAEIMTKGVQQIFKSVAAQVAKQYLLSPKSGSSAATVEGTVDSTQQVLFTRNLTLRAMESILSVLAAVSIFLAVRPIRHKMPQDPASIARLTSIISQSQQFNYLISTSGHGPLDRMKTGLSEKYGVASSQHSHKDDHSEIQQSSVESYEDATHQTADDVGKDWRPCTTLWYIQVGLLVVPFCTIVALEATVRVSQRDNGLLNVVPGKITQYASSFFPVLVMVLTKLLFSMFDFDLRIIDPYNQLKNGYAKAKTSILSKTIHHWKTDAFWIAFLNGQIAIGASVLSVMIASFLTIAASGLFSTVPIVHEETLNVQRLDSFYDVSNGTSNVSMAMRSNMNYTTGIAARLVVYDQLNSASWALGPYVVPKLSLPPAKSHSNNITSYDVDLPVQRGALTCELVTQDKISLNYTDNKVNGTKAGVGNLFIKWPMLEELQCLGLDQDNQTAAQRVVVLEDGPYAGFTSSTTPGPRHSGCPTSYGVYGTWEGQRATEINVMLCWSSIQEMNASVHFTLPDWKIKSIQVHEETIRNISSGPNTQLDLRIAVFGPQNPYRRKVAPEFSAFIRNTSTNQDDVSFLKYQNFDKLQERIHSVYGTITAQFLNREGRSDNVTGVTTIIPGTATDRSTFRLKQNPISTRVLQGLLIALILCAITSLLTQSPTKVLPKNPCSIAAQASLVVGSLMMAKLPPEAQWMDDKEFNELFEDARYSMGWSEDVDGKEWYGIDVDLRPRPKKAKRWWQWR